MPMRPTTTLAARPPQGLIRTISRDRSYFGGTRPGGGATGSGRLRGRAGRTAERAIETEDVEPREGLSPPELQLGRLTGQEVLLI